MNIFMFMLDRENGSKILNGYEESKEKARNNHTVQKINHLESTIKNGFEKEMAINILKYAKAKDSFEDAV